LHIFFIKYAEELRLFHDRVVLVVYYNENQ
jgi:hypothetical protein